MSESHPLSNPFLLPLSPRDIEECAAQVLRSYDARAFAYLADRLTEAESEVERANWLSIEARYRIGLLNAQGAVTGIASGSAGVVIDAAAATV